MLRWPSLCPRRCPRNVTHPVGAHWPLPRPLDPALAATIGRFSSQRLRRRASATAHMATCTLLRRALSSDTGRTSLSGMDLAPTLVGRASGSPPAALLTAVQPVILATHGKLVGSRPRGPGVWCSSAGRRAKPSRRHGARADGPRRRLALRVSWPRVPGHGAPGLPGWWGAANPPRTPATVSSVRRMALWALPLSLTEGARSPPAKDGIPRRSTGSIFAAPGGRGYAGAYGNERPGNHGGTRQPTGQGVADAYRRLSLTGSDNASAQRVADHIGRRP